MNKGHKIGDIINSNTGDLISMEQMILDLSSVSIVYLGEKHSNLNHHKKQLEIINFLRKYDYNLSIGMEMFDYTYQDVLSNWSKGKLCKSEFLKISHWYANWRFNFELYEGILNYIKNNKLKSIGLNIPFHIPAKISIGGIGTLSNEERKHLPRKIDLTDCKHKEYTKQVYKQHRSIHLLGRDDFDSFYEAQCVWEDFMAQKIIENIDKNLIIILVGNGHIINKFGIPNRVYKMSNLPFKTVYMVGIDDNVDYSFGDYIIFTRN